MQYESDKNYVNSVLATSMMGMQKKTNAWMILVKRFKTNYNARKLTPLLQSAAAGVVSPRKLHNFHFLFEMYSLLFTLPPHHKPRCSHMADDVDTRQATAINSRV